MRNITHVLMAAAALVVSAACTVDHTVVPAVSSPSEQAISLRLSASPDAVPADGATQSRISVQAFGPTGQPYPNLTVRMSVNGLGTLSAAAVVTASDGKAVNVFTAPVVASGSAGLTSVLATALGSDAIASNTYQVNIALTPLGGAAPPASAPSAPPVGKFTVSPSAPGLNQSVFFNASGSTAASGHQVTAYAWDFGDGTTGSGATPSHSYFRAGSDTVTLIVTDDTGQSSFPVTATVTVSSTSAQIVADFTFSPTDPVVATAVFFDSTQSASSSPITSYVWDFGDGNVCNNGAGVCGGGTAAKPIHAYGSVHTFVVRLTVTDSTGATATVTKNVVVK